MPARPDPFKHARCRQQPFSGYPVAGFTSGKDSIQIVKRPKSHAVPGFLGGTADMRHQKHVGQLPVFRMDVRLIIVYVQTGGGQLSGLEGRDQASSSITTPRLALTTMAPSGKRAMRSAFSSLMVSGDAMVWRVKKSQWGIRSSGVS